MPPSRRFLKPETLAALRGLELRARRTAAGFVSGMHRSPYHGYSVEFAEHRAYVPGDDIRHIDWRIFGRADRLSVKEYEEETNLRCTILLDVSRSMAYGQRISKLEYACELAATLAHLIIHQQDAVGLVTFDSRVRAHTTPGGGRGRLSTFLRVLEQVEPGDQTALDSVLHRLANELARRSMVVLISDLLVDADKLTRGLDRLCAQGHELIVLHVMDSDEWDFPFRENVLFEGLEDTSRLLSDPQSLRAGYLQAVEAFTRKVRIACLRRGADYVAVNTRDGVDVVLAGLLQDRLKRRPAHSPLKTPAGGG